MNATLTLVFFLATSAMDAADAYVSELQQLQQQRQAQAVRLAKLRADLDAIKAKMAENDERWREITERIKEEREQSKRLNDARTDGARRRAEALARVGERERRAAVDRCTATHSRVR